MSFPSPPTSPLTRHRAPLRAAGDTPPRRRRVAVVVVAAVAAVVACAVATIVVVTVTGRTDASRSSPATGTAARDTTGGPVDTGSGTGTDPDPDADLNVVAAPGTRVQTVLAAAPRGLRAGDVVDVIAAFDPDVLPGSEPSLRVARRARVLDVRDGPGATEVTLAVTVPEDTRVAFAARYGDLTLSAAPADDDRTGDAVALPDGTEERARRLPGDGG